MPESNKLALVSDATTVLNTTSSLPSNKCITYQEMLDMISQNTMNGKNIGCIVLCDKNVIITSSNIPHDYEFVVMEDGLKIYAWKSRSEPPTQLSININNGYGYINPSLSFNVGNPIFNIGTHTQNCLVLHILNHNGDTIDDIRLDSTEPYSYRGCEIIIISSWKVYN